MAKRSPGEPEADPDRTPARVREIGRQLREARQRRGEDLYDIADYLRIRPAYLFALEEGAFDAMPGKPYALGFLRTYADYLGFDGQDLVGEVKSIDVPQTPVIPLASGPSAAPGRPSGGPRGQSQAGARKVAPPPTSRALPSTPLLLASVGLIALAYGGWYVAQADGSALDRVARLPGELGQYAVQLFDANRGGAADEAPPAEAEEAPPPAPLPARTVSPPPVAASAERTAAPAPPPVRIEAPLAEADPPPAPAVAIEQFSIADVPLPPPPAGAGGSAATAPGALPAAPETSPTAPPGEEGVRVVLVAVEPSWIQVKSEGRDYVRTRTLEPGDRFVLPDRDDLALWTGNAGGIEIMLDGQSLGPIGDRGAVMRDIPLDPAKLKGRFR